MNTVKVSPKYQVVIPSEIRDHMHIEAGEKVMVMEKDGIIQIIPIDNIRNMRGRYPDLTQEGLRDERDRS